MLKTRVIPCLLLKDKGLVKTIKFKDPKYVGDPINAVRIFNEKEVDELVFLDISASLEGRKPNFKVIGDIAAQTFMPLGYGGGIRDIEDIKTLFSIGVEKVVINSAAIDNPDIIKQASNVAGSQSIVISIDVKKNLWGKYEVYVHSGQVRTKLNPVEWAKKVESLGAGEIFLNAIDKDGTMSGYDIDLIKQVSSSVNIPVVACGGAGSLNDFLEAVKEGGASAVSAGSFFVFHGKHRAVLITYPSINELEETFDEKN